MIGQTVVHAPYNRSFFFKCFTNASCEQHQCCPSRLQFFLPGIFPPTVIDGRRQAQSFKAADVAAAFADLRDGPKTFGAASPTGTTQARGAAAGGGTGGGAQQVVEVEEVLGEEEDDDDDDDDDAGELFVIGDDESETSEVWCLRRCFSLSSVSALSARSRKQSRKGRTAVLHKLW